MPRQIFSGQEYFQDGYSSADGVALLLGVNRPSNRQLWIGDSEAIRTGNPIVVRIFVGGSHSGIDVMTTDGQLGALTVGGGGGVHISPEGGNVGVGTRTPAARFHVAGDAQFDGTVTGGNIQAKYQDVAEWVPAAVDMSAGTVVVLNPEKPNEVMPSNSAYDARVAGVVSVAPGLLLGESGAAKEMIATTGRVRVQVDATARPVRIGDLLVTSNKAGMAMVSEPVDFAGRKFHQPGTIIGKDSRAA